MNEQQQREAYQDGPDFYDAITDQVIASFPEMVKSDTDLKGAMSAREKFRDLHPNIKLIG